jgi:hypothetical protein
LEGKEAVSLFESTQAHFSEAQEILAQMMGKPASGAGNTLYRGGNLTLVYGTPRVVEPFNVGGGSRPRTEVPATLTRTQMSAPPVSKEQLVRTDVTPHITYRIDTVDTHDPIHYVLVLVKVGE